MELKNLLSVVIAALTALGAMLFAMGSQSPLLAMSLWLAAVVSLVVTDFLGAVRVPRSVATFVIWGVLAIFLPQILLQILLQHDFDNLLQSIAGILLCLQITLLFQEKDARVYGWLAVMSLLQAVVAARYSQGVAFGALLVAYSLVGMLAMSLLVLYSQWERHRGPVGDRAKSGAQAAGVRQDARAKSLRAFYRHWGRNGGATEDSKPVTTPSRMGFSPSPKEDGLKPILPARWPLAAMQSNFSSVPTGTGRSGVVVELFARLALIGTGAMFLAAVMFYTVPRPRRPAWHGDSGRTIATVGFSDKIELGGLGETMEDPHEVLQLKLVDQATDEVDPMRDDVYLRGSVVTWYAQNHWRREPPPNSPESRLPSWQQGQLRENAEKGPGFQIGPPVVQQVTMEPYLDRLDLFYIWPLEKRLTGAVVLSPGGKLQRMPAGLSAEPSGDHFKYEVVTSALVDGRQAQLIPSSVDVPVAPYLQMPGDPLPLPRLKALAAEWLRESGLSKERHYDVARWFERQLSTSGQFQYSLKGAERDTSLDAVDDFVSNHRSGHCEYFATALAMMLRSQGIPSRVVLGYHCDEWLENEQCYQVRQWHAHAWVEAFLDQSQVRQAPKELRGSAGIDWTHGGWLRLDATPAGVVGTKAAESTLWGAWQGRLHAFQRYWDQYIVDMDRAKQRESVYEPINRAMQNVTRRLFDFGWWKGLAAGLWASLAAMLRRGIMGWLFAVFVLLVAAVVLAMLGWWLVRGLGWLWRRFAGVGGRRQAGARQGSMGRAIEFYHRFEQIFARSGMQRAAGQTPCEFAHAAGTRLATVSGRSELYTRAMQVVEAFYRVRFGRRELDPAAARTVERALEELTAGSEKVAGTHRVP